MIHCYTPFRRRLLLNFVFIVAVGLGACSEDRPEYRPLPAGASVLAFGDSITYGVGAPRTQNYPTELAALTGWNMINAGISGDMARDAGRRLPALLTQHAPTLVIIELGGNDFLRKRPESQVKADLAAMIDTVIQHGATPILVAVPRLSLLRASTGTLKDADIYAELADEYGIWLREDTLSEVLSTPELRADKIHPNAEGYRQLAAGIADTLRQARLLAH